MPKLKFVDSLRGLAILGVLMVHCGMTGSGHDSMPDSLVTFLNSGQYGVQLFFLTSSFTLFLSYTSRSTNIINIKKNFFIRRFFRIVPLYYAGLLYYIIERVVGFNFFSTGLLLNEFSWGAFLSNIFFIHGILPSWINSYVPGGWSITVEMTFYLLFPFIFSKVKNLNDSILFFLLTLFILTGLNFLLTTNIYWDKMNFLYYYLPNQMPVFALGIMVNFLIVEKDKTIKNSTLVLTLFAGLFFCYIQIGVHILFSLAFFLLLYILSKKEYKILVNPITIYIGKISYSMYITHFGIIYFLNRIGFVNYIIVDSPWSSVLNYIIRFAFLLILTIGLSTITFKIIEVPFQNIGASIIKKIGLKKSILQPIIVSKE